MKARHHRPRITALALLALVLVLGLVLAACGGSSSSAAHKASPAQQQLRAARVSEMTACLEKEGVLAPKTSKGGRSVLRLKPGANLQRARAVFKKCGALALKTKAPVVASPSSSHEIVKSSPAADGKFTPLLICLKQHGALKPKGEVKPGQPQKKTSAEEYKAAVEECEATIHGK